MRRAAMVLTLLAPLAVGASPLPEPAKVSCVLTNHPVVTIHLNEDRSRGREVEVDDWYIQCTIMVKGVKVYDAQLTTGHPEEFRDSMAAVDEFRKVKAAAILKEMKK